MKGRYCHLNNSGNQTSLRTCRHREPRRSRRIWMYSRLALLYKKKLLNLTGSHELSEKTVSIYWELRNLFCLKEVAAFCLTEGDIIENVPFTDTADHLRRVVPLTQLEPLFETKPDSLDIYIVWICCAGAHVFVNARLFQRPSIQ
jgi:hypothetical protein